MSTYIGSGGDGGSKYTYKVSDKCKYYTAVASEAINCASQWFQSVQHITNIFYYKADGSTLIKNESSNLNVKMSIPNGTKYLVIAMGSWNGSGARDNFVTLKGSTN